jgi:endonuclease/exonuclease/phosphatase family metal-dependent hydrolase
LSFNVHHGVGADGRADLERIAVLVAACAPDVVALQEVDSRLGPRSGGVDQPAWLGRRLGMAVAFGPTIDLAPSTPGGPRRRYGSAVLSPWPLRWWRNPPLPNPVGGETRRYVEAELDVEGAAVRVLATHLQHDAAAGRRAQLRHLAGVAAGVAAGGPTGVGARRPVVLLGDLNAAPGAPELDELAGVLVDAWPVAGSGDRRTFPARRPRMAIDHVFTSPDVGVEAVTVVPSDASDHRPVVADLVLPGAPDLVTAP